MKVETTRFGWKATITKETIAKNMKNFAAMFSPKKTGTFLVGDKVSAFGNEGIVKSVSDNGYVEVVFAEAPATVIFRADGRMFGWQKSPSLVRV